MFWNALGSLKILQSRIQILMSLYLWINLLSLSIPFLVSFDSRIQLYKRWKELFLAIGMSMTPYIIWDVYFTQKGYWGFNETYLSGVYLLNLPAEEWLFFICIPYACVFTHISLLIINKSLKLSLVLTKRITFILLFFLGTIPILYFKQAYTTIDSIFAFIILLLVYVYNKSLLRSYYITFLVMLIPFFIVNGILTGSGIEDEVVWYNDQENFGIRIFTIPVEDIAYAFSLILLNLFLFEKLKSSRKNSEVSA